MGGKENTSGRTPDESQPSASNVHIPKTLGTQKSLNALVGKSLVGETIERLLSSLAPSTQTTYLRCWKFWSRYCEARGVSPWLDPSKQDWDVEILNYSTWGYSIVKIGGSGLGTRFSAIKFIHAVEGRGDFEKKTHRIFSLIDAVKRKGDQATASCEPRTAEMGQSQDVSI